MADKKRYGKYEVVGKLGVGGMGVVYKGFDALINRHVAIKTMTVDKGVDENLKKRFYREAQSAGALNHANIVTIFDMDEEDGQPYIAMELLSGVDLKEIISKRIQLPIEKKVDIVAQACDGLDYAHKHGIIHRDIKPGNIRLLDNGLVKILDFGIARIESSELTKTGMVMGTVSYMSPEQIAGKRVDGRSDVFSIGVVFYELMTGRKPFPGEAITTIIYKIMNEAPDALRKADSTILPAPIEKIINRALSKDPAKRYPNASQMAEELREFLGTLQTQDVTLPELDSATMMAPSKTATAALTSPPTTPPPPPTGRTKPPPPTPTIVSRPLAPPSPPVTRLAPPTPPVPPSVPLMPSREGERTLAPAPDRKPGGPPPPPQTFAAVKTVTPPTARPALAPPSPREPSTTTTRPSARALDDIATMSRPATTPARRDTPTEHAPAGPPRLMVPIVATIVGLAAVGVLGYFFLFRDRGVAPAGEKGLVSIDVRPWAKVAEVVNVESKSKVEVGSPVTPCRITLPAGKYEITVVNEQFGQPQKVQVEVKPNGSAHVSQDLPGFDVENVLKGL